MFDDFNLTDLWKIYQRSIEIGQEKSELEKLKTDDKACEIRSETYFNLKIPVLILLYELVNCDEIKNQETNNSSNSAIINNRSYQEIFANLCEIIDENDEKTPSDLPQPLPKLYLKKITKEIIKNGLLVFFPSDKIRKESFFEMIETSIDQPTKNDVNSSFKKLSTQLLFKSFCNLFCYNKSILIHHLKKSESSSLFENASFCSETLRFIDKLIKFGFVLNDSMVNSDDKMYMALYDLLNSIQSNLFFNIQDQLVKLKSDSNEKIDSNIKRFLIEYTDFIIDKTSQLVEPITKNKENDNSKLLNKLKNFLKKITGNFLLLMSEVFNHLNLETCTQIAQRLFRFQSLIARIENNFEEKKVFIFDF